MEDPALPPQAIEAEQAVLGRLLLDNSRFDLIADRLVPEDFYRHEHHLIFSAISALSSAGSTADVVTVSEWLQKSEKLDAAGGLAYLTTLASNTPSAANICAYAGIVQELSIRRLLIKAGHDIAEMAYRPEGRHARALINEAEQSIMAVSEGRTQRHGEFKAFRYLLTLAIDRIDHLFHSDSPHTGVPTGFTDLDAKISGLQAGDLVIVAGRPSMGKISLAMSMAVHVAIGLRLPVAIYSMGMPAVQLALRMLASHGRIDAHKVRTGKLSDGDWPRLAEAVGQLKDAPMFIDDTPALTPLELRSRARRLKREHGLGLVIVDNLQLIQPPDGGENRAVDVANIARAIKILAKELDVPVVVLSQLNRELEKRHDKRPVLSDLLESEAIEQEADLILFIYRDEVYNKDSQDKGIAEIIIGKQRNGPIGTVRLCFLAEHTRFENYTSGGYGQDF